MSVVVVSDAHLGGPGGEAGPLVSQLDSLQVGECREVVFLGDLFHVWVGDRRYETRQIRECWPAIERLRHRGIQTTYIEGNRDFFLVGSPYASAFDRIVLRHSFECAGVRYLTVHGDGINRDDRQYLFWRWLSKSTVSRLLFRNIPGALARLIVNGTEKHLASTNPEHRRDLPEEAIVQFCDPLLRAGHDMVLLGHFHEDFERQTAHGRIRIVDAWYQTPALLWIDDEGPRYGEQTRIVPLHGGTTKGRQTNVAR